ncbi:hypothetical protein T03_10423 [Trichinella britovi]|uniref:Uncharacterized protein n=1 Tax=Trichinella britovi TaxID=45882 RepID=A0A0V1CC51_TRIBR|nr:hypothetical protein T03_10423 [Trichinella britovi]
MVRAYQESLTVKIRPELAQGPYQTEHFSPCRAIPTLSLGQRATRVRHDSFGFLFPLAQHRPKAVSAGVHVDNELLMEVRIGEDGRCPSLQSKGAIICMRNRTEYSVHI